jgi:hypothetical protein
VFTKEKLDEISAMLEYFPQKFLRGLTQETGFKDSNFKFQVCSVSEKRTSMHECELFMEVQGMCAYQQGPFLASAISWVDFAYDFLAYGLVECSMGPITHRKS